MTKIFLFLLCTFFAFQPPTTFAKTPPPMKKYATKNGMPYALVAGGSKGIGYAVANALGKRHYNLILIARGMDSLTKAKQVIEELYNVEVKILSKDLSLENSAEEIAAYCMENKLPVSFLANVAGLGGADDYLTLPLEKLRYMVNLNVESAMALTLTMLPNLEMNTPAHIVNVASMAGMAPIPTKNMYSATKSAVMYFSYNLRYQLKEKNISVSCLCPGPVYTKESIRETTHKNLGKNIGDWMAVPPPKVGEVTVCKTLKGRMIIVPGGLAKTFSIFLRMLPKRWSASMYNAVASEN